MREITGHTVSGDQAVQLSIFAVDDPDPNAGGANHHYTIGVDQLGIGAEAGNFHMDVHFQYGSIKEHGINGATHEAFAALVIDRLETFQNGTHPCYENARALACFKDGLEWLQKRTLARIARGVEGTNAK